jgi:type II secretory pathway pseudopilin PulG
MQKRSRARRTAFTFLELIAVVVLIGLVATLGAISVTGYSDQAILHQTARAITLADSNERLASRKSPIPGELQIEKSKGRMRFRNAGRMLILDDRVSISDVIVFPPASQRSVRFSQSGQSPTYAIGLKSKRGATRWVVVVGVTGQPWYLDSADDARSMLALANGSRE